MNSGALSTFQAQIVNGRGTWVSVLAKRRTQDQEKLCRIVFRREPYCLGDLKKDPDLENYPVVVRNPRP